MYIIRKRLLMTARLRKRRKIINVLRKNNLNRMSRSLNVNAC